MSMVLGYLPCSDLEAFHQCNSTCRETILSLTSYCRVLSHAPTILSILKKTELDKIFTIEEVYQTLVTRGCTVCGKFSKLVFLPSFTRCCQTCAETQSKFMPITTKGAKMAFSVTKEALNSLPHMKIIPNVYTNGEGSIKSCKKSITLLSRNIAQKLRNPSHVVTDPKYDPARMAMTSIKSYQRYMAITPLPYFSRQKGVVEGSFHCGGCVLRATGHNACIVLRDKNFQTMEEVEAAFVMLPDNSIPCLIQKQRISCASARWRKASSRRKARRRQ